MKEPCMYHINLIPFPLDVFNGKSLHESALFELKKALFFTKKSFWKSVTPKVRISNSFIEDCKRIIALNNEKKNA
jgi:hypothetical protein